MRALTKALAVAAMTAGVMLAAAPVSAATINTALSAPSGPYNLGNPAGNIPAFQALKVNSYNFTFAVTPGTYNLSAFISGSGPVLGPQNIKFTLYSGSPPTPGSGLLATSAVGISPIVALQNVALGGNYFIHVDKADLTLREETLSGGILLSAVPEPATWAMLISGFGLLGLAARRRRSLGLATA